MNVTFFMGAGASVVAGLPTTVELLQKLKNNHNKDSIALLGLYPNSDIEHLLSDMEEFSRYESSLLNAVLASYTDRNLDRVKKDMDDIRGEIRHMLFKMFAVHDDSIERYRSAFRHIARMHQQSRVRIATTNYDMLVEEACCKEGIGITDGFSSRAGGLRPFWANDWKYVAEFVELVKLHGSLNWRQRPDGIIRESNDFMPSEEQDLLIAPTLGNKNYEKSTIFGALFKRFERMLSDTDVLVAIGTSWRDTEIVGQIKKRLDANMKILTIGPSANSITSGVFGKTTPLHLVDDRIEMRVTVAATGIYTLNERFDKRVAKAISHAIEIIHDTSP